MHSLCEYKYHPQGNFKDLTIDADELHWTYEIV